MTPDSKKRSPGYWVGYLIMIFGCALLGAFVSKQFKVKEEGDNYYAWMAGAVAIGIVGVCTMFISKAQK